MRTSISRGWIVTACGAGLNLTLGCIYSWSVFSKALSSSAPDGVHSYGWTTTIATLPYTIAIVVWALMMFPAGYIQDHYGPRVSATLCAILMGIGFVLTSFATPESSTMAFVGFGLLMGAALGFGYGAATPAAVKWFPLHKKGLIAGLVVGGLGMSSVYVAPLAGWLINQYSISQAFIYLGLGFAVVAIILAQFIRNPPEGYTPAVAPAKASAKPKPAVHHHQSTPSGMLKEPVFYLLYIQFIAATMAGLMIISQMAKIVQVQGLATDAWTAEDILTTAVLSVSVLAVFNAIGRVVCGVLSDLIGRSYTLFLVSVIQCVTMLFFSSLTGMSGLYLGAALVGFNYGACLPVFAAICGDMWGMKNFGKNYALLFTAWGISGVIGPMLCAYVVDMTKTAENLGGDYSLSYTIAAIMCALSAVLAIIINQVTKARHRRIQAMYENGPAV